MKKIYLSLCLLGLLTACNTQNTKEKVDLIVFNATVYTVDKDFSTQEAFAVKDGKFIEVGKTEDILKKYEAKEQKDLKGKFVYPGFYDAHCHFVGYGLGLQTADLTGTKSFQEILERLKEFEKNNPDKQWITGRGWDQNDWENKEFPTKDELDKLFPKKNVFLTRVDGHAALVNQQVLDIAKISSKTIINGGAIIQKDGKPTGILVDNAVELVEKLIPAPSDADSEKALLDAEKNCFEVGLTTVADAGLNRKAIELIDKMQRENKLSMRVYAMISAGDIKSVEYYLDKGKYKTDFLNVCSFKIYADGALGSRGACLLDPYHDKPKETGFLLSTPKSLDSMIAIIAEKNFQVNTHCIGDSANRLLLDIYGKHLKTKNDLRWRIEHAQVVSPTDMKKFEAYGVIPSIQPTHCTSDMYWADERLGKERLKNAYAYKDLYANAKILALGSDFPVEHINPLYGFYAAVARQDLKGYPENGFQPENALSREQALRGMTIWAAFSCFEDIEKGSIEQGKFADFIVLEEDIMKIENQKIPLLKVLFTFVGGKNVFQRADKEAKNG